MRSRTRKSTGGREASRSRSSRAAPRRASSYHNKDRGHSSEPDSTEPESSSSPSPEPGLKNQSQGGSSQGAVKSFKLKLNGPKAVGGEGSQKSSQGAFSSSSSSTKQQQQQPQQQQKTTQATMPKLSLKFGAGRKQPSDGFRQTTLSFPKREAVAAPAQSPAPAVAVSEPAVAPPSVTQQLTAVTPQAKEKVKAKGKENKKEKEVEAEIETKEEVESIPEVVVTPEPSKSRSSRKRKAPGGRKSGVKREPRDSFATDSDVATPAPFVKRSNVSTEELTPRATPVPPSRKSPSTKQRRQEKKEEEEKEPSPAAISTTESKMDLDAADASIEDKDKGKPPEELLVFETDRPQRNRKRPDVYNPYAPVPNGRRNSESQQSNGGGTAGGVGEDATTAHNVKQSKLFNQKGQFIEPKTVCDKKIAWQYDPQPWLKENKPLISPNIFQFGMQPLGHMPVRERTIEVFTKPVPLVTEDPPDAIIDRYYDMRGMKQDPKDSLRDFHHCNTWGMGSHPVAKNIAADMKRINNRYVDFGLLDHEGDWIFEDSEVPPRTPVPAAGQSVPSTAVSNTAAVNKAVAGTSKPITSAAPANATPETSEKIEPAHEGNSGPDIPDTVNITPEVPVIIHDEDEAMPDADLEERAQFLRNLITAGSMSLERSIRIVKLMKKLAQDDSDLHGLQNLDDTEAGHLVAGWVAGSSVARETLRAKAQDKDDDFRDPSIASTSTVSGSKRTIAERLHDEENVDEAQEAVSHESRLVAEPAPPLVRRGSEHAHDLKGSVNFVLKNFRAKDKDLNRKLEMYDQWDRVYHERRGPNYRQQIHDPVTIYADEESDIRSDPDPTCKRPWIPCPPPSMADLHEKRPREKTPPPQGTLSAQGTPRKAAISRVGTPRKRRSRRKTIGQR